MTWNFTDRGEGVRNTTSLLGGRGDEGGMLHWTGNFDEVQDFEHDIRGAFGGTGFLSDQQFNSNNRNAPLGNPKAGLNPDLDNLAEYVRSLRELPRSPFKAAAGTYSDQAGQGARLSLLCTVQVAIRELFFLTVPAEFVMMLAPLLRHLESGLMAHWTALTPLRFQGFSDQLPTFMTVRLPRWTLF